VQQGESVEVFGALGVVLMGSHPSASRNEFGVEVELNALLLSGPDASPNDGAALSFVLAVLPTGELMEFAGALEQLLAGRFARRYVATPFVALTRFDTAVRAQLTVRHVGSLG
jgi:hypothetical protein